MVSPEQRQLERGIAALEMQRHVLGDAVVNASIAGLRAQLAAVTAAPQPPAEPSMALRQVSILFVDVVGSTALAQQLDPEAVGAVMDDALSRGTTIVRAHGGTVLQYAGDNILAAFGAERSREDDAERAVQCGLAMLALGRTLGAEVQATHGHDGFNVRVGIHTSSVLLGGGVDAEGSIRGSGVNIAARMEQTAPAGGLRISADTWAHVRGLFEVEAQAPVVVKGVAEPLQSWLVHRAIPQAPRRSARGIEGVKTRMVGRGQELSVLSGAFTRLFEEQRFAAVTVVGDAGIGKSRLLDEFEAWTQNRFERFIRLRGGTTPQTEGQVFGLLRDILARHFLIVDDDSLKSARSKIERGVVPLFVDDDGPDMAEGHAHLLGHLVGIDWRDSPHIKGILDDPRQIRNRAFHAAAHWLRRCATREGCPVLLQLEDLHWADRESLDFLNYLAETSRDVPLLVLACTRPTLFERRTDWSSTEGVHHRVDLLPLGAAASRALTDELLTDLPEVPAAVSDLLARQAEGNPFYIEEMVKMLIDRGAIETGRPWKVNLEKLGLMQLPTTLTGVLQARLDSLPEIERRTLQQASVVGTVFWDQVLAAIDAQAPEQLPALARRALALPRGEGSVEGLMEYAFHHQLLQQVTYATVLKRDRRESHGKVARWLAALAEQGSARAGDFLGTAAEHFELAGDAANAADFHTRAAEHAAGRFAHDRLLHHVERAIVLLGDPQSEQAGQAALRWRLLSVRENTWGTLGRREEQARDLDSLEALSDLLDDDRRRAQAARLRALWAVRLADWPAAQQAARRGMDCALRAGDDALRLHALRLLAVALVFQGNVVAGESLAEKGLAEAQGLGFRDVEARLYNVLASAAHRRDDMARSLDMTRRYLSLSRELGDRLNEAIGLMNVGMNLTNLGDLTNGQQALNAALPLMLAVGERHGQGGIHISLAEVALFRGDPAESLVQAQLALDIAVASRAPHKQTVALGSVGCAQLALGQLELARQAFTDMHAVAVSCGMLVGDALARLAEVHLARGDAAAALTTLEPVLDCADDVDELASVEKSRTEWTCHRTLACLHDPRASEWLARAYRTLMGQAASISDAALCRCFLENIPVHREIVAAWAATGRG